MSSRHQWWGPPAPTFWDHCAATGIEFRIVQSRVTRGFYVNYLSEVFYVETGKIPNKLRAKMADL